MARVPEQAAPTRAVPRSAAPLRVALDARALTDASSYRGIGTYVRNLLDGLHDRPDVSVTAVAPRLLAPPRWATAEHHLRLPRALARVPADVDHSPALDPPRRSARPWVQTVPDVVALVDDDPAFAVERRRWRRWAGRVRGAQAVIAFSRHGADQAVRALGVDPARVHVVPLAPGPEFRPAPGGSEPPAGPQYVLYVGEYGPHKGFSEAGALAARLASSDLPHELWMAGRVVEDNRAAIEAALGAGGGAAGRKRIRLLGWVPDLVSLYHGAAVVVVTSRHEGFGLPALEAMACATPVVAFANSATREVVAGGGELVPDGDVGALFDAVAGVLRSPARRDELAAAGAERARCFDWRRTIDGHVAVYRAAACG